ncbi:FAD-binding oxidoreductase [Trinickia sp. LjRoot230]|uniref:NAD(P)/FAD-dependent oxidoreductase n=1 Tax=Trinickia sp. LjRoot230 TaxID=3342288 RepID=UPI003ECF7092
MTADAIVVGAGIVGAAVAAELAARGMMVEVLDAHGIGGGTTAAGMGHIVVMNETPAEFALARYSRELWLALAPQLRNADAFSRCGTLWVAADDEEWQAACALHHTFATHQVSSQLLDQQALRECEPALASSMSGGLLVEDDSIVYAPRAAQWLLTQSLGARNIRVRTDAEVVAAYARTVTLADGSCIAADCVIVANGLDAKRLVPSLPLEPKKGHLLITDRYPRFISHQLLELGYIKSAHQTQGTSVAFNAQPRPTGQLLLGSSRQFETTDAAVDLPVLAQMLARCARYLPALSQLNGVRAWTGFRGATPDGLPLIGRVGRKGLSDAPDAASVWVATGHEGLGVTTSLATAKLLAAQILGSDAEIDALPYRVDRFEAGLSNA